MAFTDYETEQLHKALLKETRRCAVTLGMKKTSVDQLTKAVGIAKGSFYKFYESKEMAFFAVLESIHSELYGVADHALSEANGLPSSERAAEAVLAVCRRLSDTGDMVFIENDAKLLLQRLPEDVKNIHYHDDETHIRQLLEKYDLVPCGGISLAAATVQGLILTVSHKEQRALCDNDHTYNKCQYNDHISADSSKSRCDRNTDRSSDQTTACFIICA